MTISERAKKWCKEAFGCFLKNEAHCYYQGATDQRKIDIDKACLWLKENISGELDVFPHKEVFDKWLEEYRNAMMEE